MMCPFKASPSAVISQPQGLRIPNTHHFVASQHYSNLTDSSIQPPQPPDPSTLDPSRLRVPETHTLDDCIRYWDLGDAHKGLLVPLKTWPKVFKPSTYRSEAVKWGKIKMVVHEYRDVCESDHIKFNNCYPGLSDHYAKLCKAINTERQARGELVERHKKRQRVADADV